MSDKTEGPESGVSIAESSLPEFDCDSPQVRQLLGDIAAAVVAHGGFFASGLTIRERSGVLSGHRDPDTNRQHAQGPLIVLPAKVLPPVAKGEWEFVDEALHVRVAATADPLTQSLLESMAHLFTLTGKPAWYLRSHPRGALAEASETVAAIRRLRPGFTTDPSPEGFLATRVYSAGPESGIESVLLPIADSLNHHRGGAPLRFISGALRVQERHPEHDSQCFVAYGGLRRDPLDLALGYAFVYEHGDTARSAPVQVEVAGLGTVSIGIKPNKARSVLDPPTATRTPSGLQLSHLTYQANDPARTTVPVRMVLQSLGVTNVDRTTQLLLGEVADANAQLLAELRATLNGQTDVEVLLSDASSVQMRVLRDFVGGLR